MLIPHKSGSVFDELRWLLVAGGSTGGAVGGERRSGSVGDLHGGERRRRRSNVIDGTGGGGWWGANFDAGNSIVDQCRVRGLEHIEYGDPTNNKPPNRIVGVVDYSLNARPC